MAGSSGMLDDETQERRENSDLVREAGKRSCQKARLVYHVASLDGFRE
jgi:hypothetical protein